MSNKKLKKWEFWTFVLSIITAIIAFILGLHMMWYAVYSRIPQTILTMIICIFDITAFCLTESVYEAISEELSERNIPCIYDILLE